MNLITQLTLLPPAEGLATDEALLISSREDGTDYIRLWIDNYAIVVGRSQSVSAEVDQTLAAKFDVPIFRRISGGGTVYHYPQNLNISIVLGNANLVGGVLQTFSALGNALASALRATGIQVEVDANSLIINGAKVAGAAQARRGKALLYHSTLLYDAPRLPIERLLLANRPDYATHTVPSNPRPTTTILQSLTSSPTLDSICQHIAHAFSAYFNTTLQHATLTCDQQKVIAHLAKTKYGTRKWNLLRSQ